MIRVLIAVVFLLAVASEGYTQSTRLMGKLRYGSPLEGDSMIVTLEVANASDQTIMIDSVTAHMASQESYAPTIEWLDPTYSLPIGAGDTLRFRLHVVTFNRGTYHVRIELRSRRDSLMYGYQLLVLPRDPVWSNWLTIGLKDCDEEVTAELQTAYYAKAPVTIDSIASLTPGWKLADPWIPISFPQKISPTVRIKRERYVMQAPSFVMYPSVGRPDTVHVPFEPRLIRHELLPAQDTLYVSVKPNEDKIVVLTARNPGYGVYHLQPAELAGSEAWSIQAIDTTQDILVTSPAQLFLSFAGQTTEGNYPVTITLRSTPCDSVMVKTVIARVGDGASVTAPSVEQAVVWPQPATNRLFVRTASPVRFEILDLLGNSKLTGSTVTGDLTVSLEGFEPGVYILRLADPDQICSQRIIVTR